MTRLNCPPRVRCVFSEGRRQIRLGGEGPPGPAAGALPESPAETVTGGDRAQGGSWRAVTRVLRSSRRGLQTAAADLLHAAMPSDCRICGGPMLGLSPVRVCEACVGRVQSLAEAGEPLCSRCGGVLGMESARFAASMGAAECTPCRLAPPAFARAVAFGSFDNEMREMLHALKFSGLRRVAEHVLGGWMAEAILLLEPEAARELVVVPVPLFRARERERGYNQAELLARYGLRQLAKLRPEWKLALRPEALVRRKETRPLYALRPDQRRRALAGAFGIGDSEAVRGREVLLVDDIFTTGATANACAGVLLRAGAAKVWVATAARAQPESVRAVEVSVARWDTPGSGESAGAEPLRE